LNLKKIRITVNTKLCCFSISCLALFS
jgi:hypothetical protein